MTKKEIGKKYEQIAIMYLKKDGYSIINTNYIYSKYGEIDIIATKNNILYFFEVKYRKTSKYGHPQEAVNSIKKQKLYKVIDYYISQNYKYEPEWSLQVFCIYEKPIKYEIISI